MTPARVYHGKPRVFALQPLLDAAELSRSGLQTVSKASGEDLRIAAEEGLTVAQADKWAVRCGFHPAEIWVDWVDLAVAS